MLTRTLMSMGFWQVSAVLRRWFGGWGGVGVGWGCNDIIHFATIPMSIINLQAIIHHHRASTHKTLVRTVLSHHQRVHHHHHHHRFNTPKQLSTNLRRLANAKNNKKLVKDR